MWLLTITALGEQNPILLFCSALPCHSEADNYMISWLTSIDTPYLMPFLSYLTSNFWIQKKTGSTGHWDPLNPGSTGVTGPWGRPDPGIHRTAKSTEHWDPPNLGIFQPPGSTKPRDPPRTAGSTEHRDPPNFGIYQTHAVQPWEW